MASSTDGNETTMAARIMDRAQLLVQTAGYNGFSYADIADELGIRKASIHYYFPSKAILCLSLLQRYRTRFRDKVQQATEPVASPKEKLRIYISFYQEAVADGRLCPCGVLTSEFPGLAPELQAEVRGFFDEQIGWVKAQLTAARTGGELHLVHDPAELATSIVGVIEGGMLLAHAQGNPEMLSQAVAGTWAMLFV